MFRKIGKYLLSAVLAFTSVIAVAGCGKDDGNDVAKLTKADYIEVFDSVTSTYSSYLASAQAAGLSYTFTDSDFIDADNDVQAKRMGQASMAMIYFVSNIYNNEEYTLKTGIDDCFVNDGYYIYDIKFATKYDADKSIITIDVVVDYRESSNLQYFSFDINYDFDNEKLNSFSILGFSGTDENKTISSVRYYKFENNSLKVLSNEASGFEEFATDVIEKMDGILANTDEENPEDYSTEYLDAMNEAMN
jgi:hypothetical protein